MRHAIWLLLPILVLFLTGIAHAQLIQNPFAQYLASVSHSPEDQLLSFTVTFDDERTFLFLSLTSQTNAYAGNIWLVYEKKTAGYEQLRDPQSLRADALAFAPVRGLQGKALVTYFPANAEEGALVAFQPDGNTLVEHDLEIEPQGKDETLYNSYFANEAAKVTVTIRPLDNPPRPLVDNGVTSFPSQTKVLNDTRALSGETASSTNKNPAPLSSTDSIPLTFLESALAVLAAGILFFLLRTRRK